MQYKVMKKNELAYKTNAGADLSKAKTELYKYVDTVKSGTHKLRADVKTILSRTKIDNDIESHMTSHVNKLISEIWRLLNLSVTRFESGNINKALQFLTNASIDVSMRMRDAVNPAFYRHFGNYNPNDAGIKRVTQELIAAYKKLADQEKKQFHTAADILRASSK